MLCKLEIMQKNTIIMATGGGGGLVAKLRPMLATPWTVCSLPGYSVRGILQARILGCHFLLQERLLQLP